VRLYLIQELTRDESNVANSFSKSQVKIQ